MPFFFDFNPRAPCGARRQALPRVLGGEGFQPTRPLRGATPGRARSGSRKCQFQPTRPLRGATGADCTGRRTTTISTHAPLAGRDSSARSTATRARRNFNPRAPCGARLWPKIESATAKAFQPTRPLRGATRKKRTPRRWHVISTHAPLAGRDDTGGSLAPSFQYFNPRAPCGARQLPPSRQSLRIDFNPRAPCGARRLDRAGVGTGVRFQPTRPLRGATGMYAKDIIDDLLFQPTRPLRGATFDAASPLRSATFQPTRPLRGATAAAVPVAMDSAFQPTRPLRGATTAMVTAFCTTIISTHAPLAGRDHGGGDLRQLRRISTHAPLAGRDHLAACQCRRLQVISTHAPLAGRDSKSVQITMHIFAITDKFQMLLHRMPPVRAFCSFLTQENHADLGANRPSDLCALVLRTIRSSVPRADTSACSRSVRFYSRTSCPSSKIEGCPFLGQ